MSLTAVGGEQPGRFDPFESTAAETVSISTTNSDQQHPYDPFVTTAAGDPAAILLDAERTDDYDPFDAPGSTTGGGLSTVEFQISGPALEEMIPAPGAAVPPPQTNASTDCEWTPTPLSKLTTNIRLPEGLLPHDCSTERLPQELGYWDPAGATRGWPLVGYQWKASAFCHQPLYFEEINLERYGYGCCGCLQYGVSAAHFFGTVPALPYLMTVDCPGECDYTLGHYRPGSCPPWRFHWPRCCDPLASATEAGVITGLIFLIP